MPLYRNQQNVLKRKGNAHETVPSPAVIEDLCCQAKTLARARCFCAISVSYQRAGCAANNRVAAFALAHRGINLA